MATDVGIINAAYALLNEQGINQLTENSPRANKASALWEMIRDEVIRDHPWKCCTKRTSISADVATPLYDWAYQYTLPQDFMKVLQVGELGYEVPYAIENGKIVTDQSAPLYFRYIYKNEDASTYDSMMVSALIYRMAAAFAYGTTGSSALRDSFIQEYNMLLKKARAVDGQDNPPEMLGDTPSLAVR